MTENYEQPNLENRPEPTKLCDCCGEERPLSKLMHFTYNFWRDVQDDPSCNLHTRVVVFCTDKDYCETLGRNRGHWLRAYRLLRGLEEPMSVEDIEP